MGRAGEVKAMPRAGELTYYQNIGEGGRGFVLNRPFAEETRGLYLMQVGALFSLLPPPPCRVLDCGCGVGWLAYFLAQSGYETVGVDVSAQAVDLARRHPLFHDWAAPEFVVGDSEELAFDGSFDVVTFFDSLHHSIDEQKAVDRAYRALKPGGVCIASETGVGHEDASQEVIAKYDVTDKDMPPRRILQLANKAGFRRCVVHARGDHIGRLLYRRPPARWKAVALSIWPLKQFAVLYHLLFGKRKFGLVALYK
jgi:SAM-dependent methyltransferase